MSIPVLDPIQDPEAERLIEASRARMETSMVHRELAVEALVAVAFAVIAIAMPLVLPVDGDVALGTSALLIVLYAAARQVGFEIGTGYTCPFLLVLVPMLFLVPAPLVPAHVAAGLMLGALVTRNRARGLGARAARPRPVVARGGARARVRRGRRYGAADGGLAGLCARPGLHVRP